MNRQTLRHVKHDMWQPISLLFYLILLSFDSMAVTKSLPLLSQEEIETQLTALDNRSKVTSVAFSPDGSWLAYGASDNRVRLWDTLSGRLLKVFEKHTQSITALAFSPDGLRLASSSKDKTIHLWEINSKTILKTFEAYPDAANSLAIHPAGNILASSSDGGAVSLWDIQSGELLRKPFNWQVQKMRSVAFSPDGQMLAIGSSDLKVRLWNTNSFKMYQPRLECTKYQHVNTLVFSPDSKMVASGFRHGMVCVWDTQSRTLIKRLSKTIKRDAFNSVTFDAEGNRLAYSFYDKIYLWDVGADEAVELPITMPDAHYITTVDFNPTFAQKNILAYAASDGTVRLWDTQQNTLFGIFAGNASGEWLSCIKQRCWCSERPCVSFSTAAAPGDEQSPSHTESTLKAEPAEAKSTEVETPVAEPVEAKSTEVETPVAEPVEAKSTEVETPVAEPVEAKSAEVQTPVAEPVEAKSAEVETPVAEPVEAKSAEVQTPVAESAEAKSAEVQTPSTEFAEAKPADVEAPVASLAETNNAYLLILFILIGIAIALLYRMFICRKNAALLATPLPQLPKKYRLLKRAGCLTQVLGKNQLSAKSLDEVIAFLQKLPDEQTEILAKRLGVKGWEPTAANFFKVQMHDNFPLNIESCLLYFPATDLSISDILNQLQQQMVWQKVVLIMLNPAQLQALRPYGEDVSNLWIVPNHIELTGWLLSPDPVQTFTGLLAEQLKVTQISPYQTRSGVNKDAVFFGRTQILDHILNREPANYLVVGGRQLGKSSLLKYLHRCYQNHPQVQCHYLTLHGDTLQGQLAVALGLPSDSDFDTVLTQALEVSPGQRRLFLIDQADQFVQTDRKNGYRTLNRFRSVSEEGHCHFILAGFWDLYYASVLDYQSPLKNFGEPITIAELEADACCNLAIKPMQSMNLRYESETLIENLLTATGQRANLIAIVCNEMLKKLQPHQRVLDEEDMAQALNSEAVREALKGWGKLSVDEQENRLDRTIVYATITQGEFKLGELMSVLETLGCTYTAEQVKQSLDRLALSFVIERESPGRYNYCVPLFREMLLEEDVDELLRWELKDM